MHRKSSEESERWQSSADRKAAEGWPRIVGYVNQRFQACYGTLSHHIGPDIQLSGRQTKQGTGVSSTSLNSVMTGTDDFALN